MTDIASQPGTGGGQTTAAAEKTIHYTVNAEPQQTAQRKLTVRTILTNAGFTPVEQYELTRDAGHHTFKNLDEEVSLHEGESFTATFTGPTPTS
jgi:phenylalanyl-tRNA synthetase beta subunit